MNNYRVGQILFLIANNTVVPVQVIEEVVRTTLKGKEKTHIVKFPNKKATEADIASIKGQVFMTKKDAYDFMIENATKAIDVMVEEAAQVAKSVFEVDLEESEESDSDIIDYQKMQPDENNNIIKVDLGGGQVGRIAKNDLEKIKGAK